MDFRQLNAAIAVADTGSVTRAAHRLHLVQPAVTRQIRALEEELGVELFERTSRGMVMTPSGETLVNYARRVLREGERVRAELRPDEVGLTGTVAVGLLESTCDLIAEPLLRTVSESHPGIALRLETAYSGHLQQWLDDGDLDLSMLYNLGSTPTIAVTTVLEEQLWVVGPADAELCADAPVTWAELARRPVVMPVVGHGLRIMIDAALQDAGVVVETVVETNALSIQRQLVAAGHGWTVLPASGVGREVADGRLRAAPVGEPPVTRSLGIALTRAGRVPPSVKAVAGALSAVVRGAAVTGRWPGSSLPSADAG